MSAITAVVFDLDGTLIDSAPDLRTALNALLAADGRRDLALDEVVSIIGDGARVLVERALALTGGDAAQDSAELTRRFIELYESCCSRDTRPYPGVGETLDRLAADGLSFGVCTNKPEQLSRLILADLGLSNRFDAVIGGDSLNGIRKPDPRPVMATLAMLGETPERAVMVGDSHNDITAARAAGLRVIYHAGGYGSADPAPLDADVVIAEFAALPDAIRGLS